MRSASTLGTALWLGLAAITAFGQGAADDDQDGVPNAQDLCAHTPAGAAAWRQGDWAGCSGGQTRDADQPQGNGTTTDNRTHIGDGIVACEDSLSAQLSNREVYAGSTCAPYAYSIQNAAQPYLDFGRADLGHPASTMTADHLTARLALCLDTDRSIARIFDAMDASHCSPYAPADGWSGNTPRVPDSTSSSGGSGGTASNPGGFYAPGVSYTTMGNITYGSNGTSYTTMGNVTYGNNGTSYTHVGNVTYGSDGSSYITSGNVTYSNHGTSCMQSGTVTYCN